MSQVKKKFSVSGMSCAACSARVEGAVKKLEGVNEVAVNLLTNEMSVSYSSPANENLIIAAVKDAGYGAAAIENGSKIDKSVAISRLSAETKGMLKRLIPGACLLLMLMYVSMGEMLKLPYPAFLKGEKNAWLVALSELLFCSAILLINRKFFISGIKSLIKLSPNMDSLVAMGSGASLLYSLYQTILIFVAVKKGNFEQALLLKRDLYFEGAAMIVVFITLGKTLESFSKGKTADAISALMTLVPTTATLLKLGEEITVDASQIKVGDILVVKTGDVIPVDGQIIYGEASIDESGLTGESIPIDKKEGDEVFSATVNVNGFIHIRATKVGEDTTLSKIINLVKNVSLTKAPIAKVADKVAGVFVPAVMGIALIVFITWLLIGVGFEQALTRCVAVLVVSCPCALGLATPVAIMVGSGKGAKIGALFKNATALENVGKIKTLVFDKTGTLTENNACVTDVIPINADEKTLKDLALSIESLSRHPLAKAVCSFLKDTAKKEKITDFRELAGLGVSGKWGNKPIIAGNLKLMEAKGVDISAAIDAVQELSSQGKTPLVFALDNKVVGVIAVADKLRDCAKEEIDRIKKMGIEAYILTGDNTVVAQAIAKELGITNNGVIAGVLPDGKANEILKLKEKGKVAMVGDGINDAPALTAADVGIAIGAGSNVAVESADVVTVGNNLAAVTDAVRLSKKVILTIKENLFWAFFYNVIAIPVAAGAFSGLGLALSPSLASLCMSFSSVSVVLNALRINLFKSSKSLDEKAAQKKQKSSNKPINGDICQNSGGACSLPNQGKIIENNEEKIMEIKLKVEGMMCHHCEMHVEKALLKIDGVSSVKADYVLGEVSISLSGEVDMNLIKTAISDEGYTVID